MGMYWYDAMKLIRKAHEKIADEMIFQRWIMGYERYESLDDFKKRLVSCEDEESSEQTLEKVAEIMKLYKFEPGGE